MDLSKWRLAHPNQDTYLFRAEETQEERRASAVIQLRAYHQHLSDQEELQNENVMLLCDAVQRCAPYCYAEVAIWICGHPAKLCVIRGSPSNIALIAQETWPNAFAPTAPAQAHYVS